MSYGHLPAVLLSILYSISHQITIPFLNMNRQSQQIGFPDICLSITNQDVWRSATDCIKKSSGYTVNSVLPPLMSVGGLESPTTWLKVTLYFNQTFFFSFWHSYGIATSIICFTGQPGRRAVIRSYPVEGWALWVHTRNLRSFWPWQCSLLLFWIIENKQAALSLGWSRQLAF